MINNYNNNIRFCRKTGIRMDYGVWNLVEHQQHGSVLSGRVTRCGHVYSCLDVSDRPKPKKCNCGTQKLCSLVFWILHFNFKKWKWQNICFRWKKTSFLLIHNWNKLILNDHLWIIFTFYIIFGPDHIFNCYVSVWGGYRFPVLPMVKPILCSYVLNIKSIISDFFYWHAFYCSHHMLLRTASMLFSDKLLY